MLGYGILLLDILYNSFKQILLINKIFSIIEKVYKIKLDLKITWEDIKKERARYENKYLKSGQENR